MRWRLILAASLALVAAVAIRWWLPGERVALTTPVMPDTRFDYTLTDFSARFSDENGELTLLVSGPRLEHHSLTRIATIQEPRFHLDPAGSNWRGESRLGRFERDEELLIMENEVVLTQPQDIGELVIETESLHHHRLERTIESITPVEMRQPGTWLRAGGLMIRLDQETIEFFNHVEAQMQVVSPDIGRSRGRPDDERQPGG
ncbi:MAG: LPS export ABC transporter periplasmic protein LptC [Wenzhouxiangella sp.]